MFDGALTHSGESSSFGPEMVTSRPVTLRMSRPAPGRSLGGTVTRVERPVRDAVTLLSRVVAVDDDVLSHIFDCTVYGPGGSREPNDLRLSWFVACATLAQALVTGRNRPAPFLSALEWLFGDPGVAHRVLACFSHQQVKAAEDQLNALSVTAEFHDLFPYVVEPHGHVTRNRLENCDKAKQTRDVKKDGGVYYTPSDVAEFMVGSLAEFSGSRSSWLDPACGTGVFLRTIISHQRNLSFPHDLSAFACSNVFGIDKSALATDLAAFTVLIECAMSNLIEESPFQLWRRIKGNIVCMDALRLRPCRTTADLLNDTDRQVEIQKVFPSVGNNGFDHVVMNPPYASARIDEALRSVWHSYSGIAVGESGDLHLAFTEMLWRLTSDQGVSAAVLPLSIGTNTTRSYLQLRRELLGCQGRKEFLFFDREPQALFGEDIKTRSLILFRQGSPVSSEVRTSRLLKWTAEQRPMIFSRDRLVTIDASTCTAFVPKLGSGGEMLAYRQLLSTDTLKRAAKFALRGSRLTLGEAVLADDPMRRQTLIVASTAYNFINCFFADALPRNPPRPYSSSPVNAIQFNSDEDAFAAYALISGRLCFWLWHVEGDGFHLTNNFLKRLPLWAALESKLTKQRLSEHGWHLWHAAKNAMVGAVNAGKQTYSFHCGYDHTAAMDAERELLLCLGLDPQFSESLDAFIEATVSIDGKSRLRRTESKLRKVV